MRVLILSCNTGEGHNSCAKAIQEVYAARGDVCVIDDALRFLSDGVSRFISNWHTRIYRYLPGLFRFGYGYMEVHPAVSYDRAGVQRLLRGSTARLRQYILEGQYDTVICVHVFAAFLLTAILEETPMELKTGFVSTDYTCHPMVRETRLDWYFVPDDSLAGQFESPSIAREQLVSSGIPIRQAFYRHTEKAAAKAAFGVAAGHTHLLMMCGSMGCGPMEQLAWLLSDGVGPDCEITIVCGTNERLRRRLETAFSRRDNVHILGFVRDMGTLMDSADLYLTKPGGLSVTEAYVKGLPMVYIDAVAGCESHNRRFFVDLGGARTDAGPEELARLCQTLMADGVARGAMTEALARQKKTNAAECIYQTMLLAKPSVQKAPCRVPVRRVHGHELRKKRRFHRPRLPFGRRP